MRSDQARYTVTRITHVEHLEDLLSEPTELVVETMARLDGDLIFLGVAGKMGPTLARMAKRADELAGKTRRILGASRFSTPGERERLEAQGIETIFCDLLDADQLARLPDAANVVFMTGTKFGSTGNEARTWAMNSFLPGLIAYKYRQSKVVAFSTGNVYGLSPVARGGSLETDTPAPVGEYSQSALGRERVFQYFCQHYKMPTALLRLNYATELRYGVLVDLAQMVLSGTPINLSMGHLNALWQGDANAMSLCAFAHVSNPPFVINLSGPELLSVRRVAEEFGRLLDRPVTFVGTEAPDAFLSNGQLGHRLFGYPRVTPHLLQTWIAEWIARGAPTLGKPTHFEVRDGNF